MEGKQANHTEISSIFSVSFCSNTELVSSSELAGQKNIILHIPLHPISVCPLFCILKKNAD